MKRQQKDLILLGVALRRLKESYKMLPVDFLKEYDANGIVSLWDQNFPSTLTEKQWKELAIDCFRNINKDRNKKYKK